MTSFLWAHLLAFWPHVSGKSPRLQPFCRRFSPSLWQKPSSPRREKWRNGGSSYHGCSGCPSLLDPSNISARANEKEGAASRWF